MRKLVSVFALATLLATLAMLQSSDQVFAADDDDKVAFPVGLGVTHTFKIGKFPARLLLEGQYYVIRRDSYGPE